MAPKTPEEHLDEAIHLQDKEREIALEQELLKLEEQRKKVADDIGTSVKGQLSNWTGIKTESDTIAGKMTRMLSDAIKYGDVLGSIKETFKSIGKSLMDLFSPTNILASLFDVIVKSTLKFLENQDEIGKSIETSVGNASMLKGEVMALYGAGGAYATTMKEAAAAFIDLKSGFAGFEDLSQRHRMGLAETNLQLAKLGINTKELVKSEDLLHKSMKMSITEITKMEKQLYGTAVAMGIPPQKMMSEFASAAPRLAVYGKQMSGVFLDLQNQAKKTGLEMNELLGIADRFGTFEDAAANVGELNAILGGDFLDAQKMMNMNEAERIKYLGEQLRASGKSLDSMDRFEKQAIAQRLGLKDVSQLMAVYNNETGKTGNKLTDQEKAQQTMNRAMSNAVSLTDRLNRLFEEFGAIFGPLLMPIVDLVKDMAVVLGKYVQQFARWINEHGGFLGIIKKTWETIKPFLKSLWEEWIKPFADKILGFFGTSTDSLYETLQGGFDKIPDLVTKMKDAFKKNFDDLRKEFPLLDTIVGWIEKIKGGFDKMSTAEKGVAIGGGLITLTSILSLFSGDDVEKTNDMASALGDGEGEGGITGAIKGLGDTISGFGDTFLKFGGAIAGIGIGIGAAAGGVGSLVNALGGLADDKMTKVMDNIKELLGLFGISAAGAAVGAVGVAGLAKWASGDGTLLEGSFKSIGIGIALFGAGVGFVAWTVSGLIEQLSKLDSESKVVSRMTTIFNSIADALIKLEDGIGVSGAVAIGNMFDNMSESFEALMDLNPDKVLSFFNFLANPVSGVNIENFYKKFGAAVDASFKPTMTFLNESLNYQYTVLNNNLLPKLESFASVLERIERGSISKIVQLRTEIEKMSEQQTKFATIANALSSLMTSMSSTTAGTGLASGLVAVRTVLESFTDVHKDIINKLGQMDEQAIRALEAQNTVQFKADPGSPLDKIARALENGKLVIQMDTTEVGEVLLSDSTFVRGVKGTLKPSR
jgi:hypothetical protein